MARWPLSRTSLGGLTRVTHNVILRQTTYSHSRVEDGLQTYVDRMHEQTQTSYIRRYALQELLPPAGRFSLPDRNHAIPPERSRRLASNYQSEKTLRLLTR